MDPDSIYGQSAGGILSGTSVEKVLFLGGLGSEVELFEQDAVAADILERFNCVPVFLGAELKDKYYKASVVHGAVTVATDARPPRGGKGGFVHASTTLSLLLAYLDHSLET